MRADKGWSALIYPLVYDGVPIKIITLEKTNENYGPYSIWKKSFFADWLEKLQQESWQLELLISGFALFGIQKSRGLIFAFQECLYFEYMSPILKISLRVFEVGWKIFFFNLLIHVIFRGLWLHWRSDVQEDKTSAIYSRIKRTN